MPWMNHVERFRAALDFQPVDRLPRIEWATWWDKTIARWHGEGLPPTLTDPFEIGQYLGLDPLRQAWFYTVFKIAPSRGSGVLEEVLGTEFRGLLGCDYFSAYRKYTEAHFANQLPPSLLPSGP